MKNFIGALLLFLSSLAIGQQDARYAKIDSLLTYLNKNNKFMGALTIREGDNVFFNKGYGFADVSKNREASRLTKYKIGSVTKTFTAVIVLQLIEEKKLSLQTKLNRFYPKIKNAEKITISDLLYQRTGIIDYINADSTMVKKVFEVNTKKDMLARIASYEPLFDPGSKFEYSNSNYYLLGCIIEEVTKKPYADNLNERIVSKINLKNTYYKTSKIETSFNESYSYIFDGTKWEEIPEWDNNMAFAAGAITSTPADLTRFMRALFKDELISKKSLDVMKTLKDSYGMALVQFPFGQRKFYGHTGGIENFRAVVGYNPEDELGISLIVNGDNFNRNEIMIGILSIYYKVPYPFPTFAKIDPDQLIKYTGNYSSKELPLKIVVTEKNGELIAQATGQPSFPLTYVKDTVFVFQTAGIEITFTENGFVLKQGGAKFTYTKD
ncbi:MAG: hypothetical protein RLY43_819 [Bacteroidota bacterium]